MLKIEVASPVPRLSRHVTIFELTATCCHWPLWSHMDKPEIDTALYCGAAVSAGDRYCQTHAAVAYNASARRVVEDSKPATPMVATSQRVPAAQAEG